MIKTEDLIEFLESPRPNTTKADEEKTQIIIHRLRFLDEIKEKISNFYSDIVAHELFENNDLKEK